LNFGLQIWRQKARNITISCGVQHTSIHCVIHVWIISVTDRQTD